MELHEIQPKILDASAELEKVGKELLQVASRMYYLKLELDEWTAEQHEDIRSKESGGYITLLSGEKMKLTDSNRELLVRYGKRKEFAEYEALKRKRDVLEIAVRALIGSQSGQQSVANIVKKEMEILGYQPN